jgi:hypothetical protein
VRGRFQSGGEFAGDARRDKQSAKDIDESSDAFDTVDWLVKNVPGHNGKVGMFGISYPGFYASAGMIEAHPNLIAVSPRPRWETGTLTTSSTRGLLPARLPLAGNNAAARPMPTTDKSPPVVYPTPDGYKLSSRRPRDVNKTLIKDAVPFWVRWQHPNRDEFWKASHHAPPQERRPHRHGCHRLATPRTCTLVQTYRSPEPGVTSSSSALAHGDSGGDSDRLGSRASATRPRRSTGRRLGSFFEKYLKGENRPAPAKRPSSKPAATPGGLDAWPPKGRKPQQLFVGEKLDFIRQPEPMRRLRRICQRPGQTGPFHRKSRR